MENSLRIKATEDSPEVNFNKDSGEFSLSGRSLPEDALEFYRPVKAWLKGYITQPNNNSDLKISLDYFNSSSVKQLLEIILLFEEIAASGKKASIIWCYTEGDDLMEIKGREFESMVENIPFEFRMIS
jgi:hypothetical protein